jgi:hypothetical protein
MTFAANRPLPTRRFRNRPETAKAVPDQPDETIWTMSFRPAHLTWPAKRFSPAFVVFRLSAAVCDPDCRGHPRPPILPRERDKD